MMPTMMLAQPAFAQAGSLQGVWQYSRVNLRSENYSGNISINANGSATDVTHRQSGADVAQSGFVTMSGSKVEIVFDKAVPAGPPTYNPDHFYCTIQSDRAMTCSNTDIKGTTSYQFSLVRVGNPGRR